MSHKATPDKVKVYHRKLQKTIAIDKKDALKYNFFENRLFFYAGFLIIVWFFLRQFNPYALMAGVIVIVMITEKIRQDFFAKLQYQVTHADKKTTSVQFSKNYLMIRSVVYGFIGIALLISTYLQYGLELRVESMLIVFISFLALSNAYNSITKLLNLHRNE
jgi:hypothetical protein